MAKKYTNPVEEAYDKGESSVFFGRGVGLRGKPAQSAVAKAIVKNQKRKGGSFIRELTGGKNTYLNETMAERRARVLGDSPRTSAISESLRKAGLTDAGIRKLRGK